MRAFQLLRGGFCRQQTQDESAPGLLKKCLVEGSTVRAECKATWKRDRRMATGALPVGQAGVWGTFHTVSH